MKALTLVQQMPAIQEIVAVGGEVYLVGGVVRDHYMNVVSKDVDIIVRLLSIEQVQQILLKHGKVELVGASFGVLKFVPTGWAGEPFDIALPRTEQKTGSGYQGFEISSDPFLPIEFDLKRRDFTINAIAVRLDGETVDPFLGVNAIKQGIIEAVSDESFSDDPLRMLRAVQFASRFGFRIGLDTLAMIQAHSADISQISGERVLIELDKIQAKGRYDVGVELLNKTGLAKHIFGATLVNSPLSSTTKTRAEFYAALLCQFANPSTQFTKLLKGDSDTAKQLGAILQLQRTLTAKSTDSEKRVAAVAAVGIGGDVVLTFETVKNLLGSGVNADFQSGMPRRVTELAVNGNDLMELGLTGKTLGDTMKLLLLKVLYLELKNEKESLLQFVTQTLLDPVA